MRYDRRGQRDETEENVGTKDHDIDLDCEVSGERLDENVKRGENQETGIIDEWVPSTVPGG
jgi:hypothetical protein